MKKASKKNIAASANQRLLNIAKQRKESFDQILLQYGLERVLYRLSISDYKHQFLLKGALIFALWTDKPHRPTRDIDLLGFGSNELEELEKIFHHICGIAVDDGLVINLNSIKIADIKEKDKYKGARVKFLARLDQARIHLQVDIGFGDAVTPGPEQHTLPTLLDMPAPSLSTYPVYTVVAEKFHALSTLGMLNTRYKDFYDLWILIEEFNLDANILSEAILATFTYRNTPLIKELPIALTEVFVSDKTKQTQWQAFLRKNQLTDNNTQLRDIVDIIQSFIWKPYIKACDKKTSA